jgi:hypothetical protein
MVRAISNKNGDSSVGLRSEFTPVAATKMLPLVRSIVADIIQLSHVIEVRRERLRGIDALPATSDHPDYRDELSDIRGSLADDEHRLEACLSELLSLGLEAHLPFDGSVDFPAVLNRRQVRLCWQPEDQQVDHWHEIGQTKEQRQKIGAQQFGVESLN